MKKFLIILIIPFLLSGCYDYNELSDLAIVSGIGIDYKNDEYSVTFEILSTKKEGETSASSGSYNVTSNGSTVFEAFNNNGNLIDKVPYFEHVDVIVISEEVAKNHLKEVGEYIIRTSKLRNESYLAIASDISAKEVIESKTKDKPVAASFITKLMENNKNSASAGYYMPYTEILNSILTDGEDAILSVVTVKENNEEKNIELVGLGVFEDFKLKHIFNIEESSILNLLSNFDHQAVYFKDKCNNDINGVIEISIYESEVKIEPNNENVKISGKLNARINEDTCNNNLREEKIYEELQKKFTKIIEQKMTNVLEILQDKNSNALKIGKYYYQKTRSPEYKLWTKQKFTYDLDLKINKKGLIFEVNK